MPNITTIHAGVVVYFTCRRTLQWQAYDKVSIGCHDGGAEGCQAIQAKSCYVLLAFHGWRRRRRRQLHICSSVKASRCIACRTMQQLDDRQSQLLFAISIIIDKCAPRHGADSQYSQARKQCIIITAVITRDGRRSHVAEESLNVGLRCFSRADVASMSSRRRQNRRRRRWRSPRAGRARCRRPAPPRWSRGAQASARAPAIRAAQQARHDRRAREGADDGAENRRALIAV